MIVVVALYTLAVQLPPMSQIERDLRGLQEIQQPEPMLDPRSPIAPIRSSILAPAPPDKIVSAQRLRHKIPKNAKKAFERGVKFAKADDHAKAISEFERAVTLDPDFANAHNDLGVQYAIVRRHQDAEHEFRTAIEIDPVFATAHFNLGLLLLGVGRPYEAETSARAAIRLAATDRRAHWLLGFLLLQLGYNRGEAIEHVEYAAQTIPQARDALKTLRPVK